MQLCKYTAQEAGLVPCPNLALDWVYPLPLHATTPASLGQPQEFRFGSAGAGAAPQRMAGLRP